MGLDNGFVGHFKRHPEVKMELAYFRKYYTLNDWVMKHGTVFDEHNPYEVAVSKENLEELLRLIEPIAEVLQGYTYNQISYYEKFYEEEFSPVSTAVDKTSEANSECRGEGIIEWVGAHEVDSFIILDDEWFDFKELGLQSRVIKTEFYDEDGGLTDDHIELAIELLNSEIPN